MKKFEVKNHEPSYLPDGDWRLVWHDEFDGTELDTSKWGFRLNFWGEPFDAYTDKGVVLDGNSHIELHRTEKNGYYECRCKFQKEPEVMWSAFWTQSPSIGARFEPQWCGVESDIMEHFKVGEATTGNIFGGYGVQFKEEGRIYYDIRV